MKGLVLILSFCVLVGCVDKDKFRLETERDALSVTLARQSKTGGYGLVTASELKDLIDTKADILVVDTMPYEASYKKQHIPGAKHFLFPIDPMENWVDSETGGKTIGQFKELLGSDPNKQIILYCGFVKCTRSHNAALWATRLGYKNVKRFPGGVFAWKGAGFPVESAK